MMKILMVLISFLGLSACVMPQSVKKASTDKYQEVLNEWLGKEKSELVDVWGNPSYDYVKNDINYVVYIKYKMKPVAKGNKIERMPRMAEDHSFFDEETATVSKGCTTLFVIEDDYIRQWRFEGSECQVY